MIVANVSTEAMKDICKVMGRASKELNRIADGKHINECAKALLS